MKIKLYKVHDLLSHCAGVIIENNLYKIQMDSLKDDPENEFAACFDGVYGYKFPEEGNYEVEINNSYILLNDNEGDLIELKLLFPTNLASFCQEGDII